MTPEEKIERMAEVSRQRAADRELRVAEARAAERERQKLAYALVKAESPEFYRFLEDGAKKGGLTYACIVVTLPGRDPIRMK